MDAAGGKAIYFNAHFLALLGIAGVSLVAVNAVMPPVGTYIAAGIAFWWLINSGGLDYLILQMNKIKKAAK